MELIMIYLLIGTCHLFDETSIINSFIDIKKQKLYYTDLFDKKRLTKYNMVNKYIYRSGSSDSVKIHNWHDIKEYKNMNNGINKDNIYILFSFPE